MDLRAWGCYSFFSSPRDSLSALRLRLAVFSAVSFTDFDAIWFSNVALNETLGSSTIDIDYLASVIQSRRAAIETISLTFIVFS